MKRHGAENRVEGVGLHWERRCIPLLEDEPRVSFVLAPPVKLIFILFYESKIDLAIFRIDTNNFNF